MQIEGQITPPPAEPKSDTPVRFLRRWAYSINGRDVETVRKDETVMLPKFLADIAVKGDDAGPFGELASEEEVEIKDQPATTTSRRRGR